MKRIRIVVLVLCACFVPAAWAQPQAVGPRINKHAIHHRAMNSLAKPDAVPQSDLATGEIGVPRIRREFDEGFRTA